MRQIRGCLRITFEYWVQPLGVAVSDVLIDPFEVVCHPSVNSGKAFRGTTHSERYDSDLIEPSWCVSLRSNEGTTGIPLTRVLCPCLITGADESLLVNVVDLERIALIRDAIARRETSRDRGVELIVFPFGSVIEVFCVCHTGCRIAFVPPISDDKHDDELKGHRCREAEQSIQICQSV